MSLGNNTSDATDTMGTHNSQLWGVHGVVGVCAVWLQAHAWDNVDTTYLGNHTTDAMDITACLVASTSNLDLCQSFYRASAAHRVCSC